MPRRLLHLGDLPATRLSPSGECFGAQRRRAALGKPLAVLADRPTRDVQQRKPGSPRLPHGEGIRMRRLDWPSSTAKTPDLVWEPGDSTEWAQSAQQDTASRDYRPLANSVSRTSIDGVKLATTNGIATPLEADLIRSEVLQSSELPALVTADLETAAGSREFVMDSKFRWAQDNYSSTQRSLEIWAFIITLRSRLWLMDQKWTYVGGFSEEKKKDRMVALAKYSREAVLQLGPTFVKLGQLFSTRSDLFPAEFTQELAKLQDQVPAFSSEKAIAIVERELSAPIDRLFRSFQRRPIAAASLGQVHRAVLHDGRQVVVKIQRPGLRKLFDIDLYNLKVFAELLDRGDPVRDFSGIYQECATILYQEIDYIREGRSADRFRRNFKEVDWVRAPSICWQYTSPIVLTLEYLPGVKISDVAALTATGLDVKQIATRATESYLIQVLKHGFLHSDPHPGNIAVGTQGELIFYDFGMMSELMPATKEKLLELFYAVYKKNASAVLTGLQDLGILVAKDPLPIRRTIQYFLENIEQQAERKETLAAIGEDLFSIAVDQPFRFPATFTFVLRAFSTLEGIGKILCGPEYSFATVAQPYAQELLDVQSMRTSALDELQRQAGEFSMAAASMPGRVAKSEAILSSLEQGSLKLRVRDSASERALRKSSIMQSATIEAVGMVGLLDVGTQVQLAGRPLLQSAPFFVGAAVLLGLIAFSLRRVKKLNDFEKEIQSF